MSNSLLAYISCNKRPVVSGLDYIIEPLPVLCGDSLDPFLLSIKTHLPVKPVLDGVRQDNCCEIDRVTDYSESKALHL